MSPTPAFDPATEAPWTVDASVPSPCEEAVHREHRAALEATLFAGSCGRDEVVLELVGGELRFLQPIR